MELKENPLDDLSLQETIKEKESRLCEHNNTQKFELGSNNFQMVRCVNCNYTAPDQHGYW